MENTSLQALIPPNIHGKPNDIEHSVTDDTREKAVDTFKRAYKRLLNLPVWHKLCGLASAEFALTGSDGQELQRLMEVGDYVRIDIPGPGSATGSGYDWSRVEIIESKIDEQGDEEYCLLQVRPCSNPTIDESDTAHFFKSEATSTFIIWRNGNTTTSSYHGRNEVPNTSVERLTDKIRNIAVAAGAMAGISELQWATLIKSLLKEEIGG